MVGDNIKIRDFYWYLDFDDFLTLRSLKDFCSKHLNDYIYVLHYIDSDHSGVASKYYIDRLDESFDYQGDFDDTTTDVLVLCLSELDYDSEDKYENTKLTQTSPQVRGKSMLKQIK